MEMKITAFWDDLSLTQLVKFATTADDELKHAVGQITDDLAQCAVTFIKPLMRGNGHWQSSTGRLANSLKYKVNRTTDGFEATFSADANNKGVYYQQYMDTGNFPASMTIYAYQHGMKVFPIASRMGETNHALPAIRGMGATSPDSPRNFSEKAVQVLDSMYFTNVADKQMQKFLDGVVISR